MLKKAAVLLVCLSGLSVGQGWAQDTGGSPVVRTLWCSVTDGASKRIFVSDPVPSRMQGHMALWSAGNSFTHIINARYALTLRGGDHVCSLFDSQAHALDARTALQARADKLSQRIITIGLY